MKTKKMNKKLTLNKKTVSDLNKLEQSKVKGGTFPTFPCPTLIPIRCSDAPSCIHEICLP